MRAEMESRVQARSELRRLGMVSCIALSALLGALTSVHAQTLTWLTSLGGDASFTQVFGVSNNGVVVGGTPLGGGVNAAFRWTQLTGMQNLNATVGPYNTAYGISKNGDVIVGTMHVTPHSGATIAFRWTEATGLVSIGTLGGCCSTARAISGSGSVIVGNSNNAGGFIRAFRWSAGPGMTELDPWGEWFESTALDVSDEAYGAVVAVGWGIAPWANYMPRPFRSDDTLGLVEIPGTPPGFTQGYAYAISGNGQVVVGGMEFFGAFRWTQANGTQLLWTDGDARDITEDGQTIVGRRMTSVLKATRWTQANGVEDLNQTYSSLLQSNAMLSEAVAISPNGRYIIGYGVDPAGETRAFVLDTQGAPPPQGDVNGDGCVDDADLLIVLFNFGCTGSECSGDANNDNIVDDADLLIVLFNFGAGC